MKRRDFLKLMPTSVAMASGVSVLNGFVGSKHANAAIPADYKALVIIELNGGNDSLNMLVPTGSYRADYDANRNAIRIANESLDIPAVDSFLNGNLNNPYLDGAPSNSSSDFLSSIYKKGHYSLSNPELKFGVNGMMPELARLFEDGQVGVLNNIGTLVEPVATDGSDISNSTLPSYLFAHNNQRRVVQTGVANDINTTGWGSRLLHKLGYVEEQLPAISVSGSPRLLQGEVNGLSMAGSKPRYLNGLNSSAFAALNDTSNEVSPLRLAAASLLNNSESRMRAISNAWGDDSFYGSDKGPYGEDLHENPSAQAGFSSNAGMSGSLIRSLDAVARMIHISQNTAGITSQPVANRQVFFVSMGGFDHHSNQSEKHPKLLRELSLGLWKFNEMLKSIGADDGVTTITTSDFGRTLKENNDGSDHAWASSQLIMGNAVNGGHAYGDFVQLEPGGNGDFKDSGRYIPTLAYDQVWASCAKWMGLSDSQLPYVFPNIGNFTGDGTIPDLFKVT